MSVFVQKSEDLIGWSRRSMWLSLVCVLYAGIAGSAIAIGGGLEFYGEAMLKFYPVLFALGLFHLGRRGIEASKSDLKELESDELRQHASARSFRYAWGAMLAAQPALALLSVFVVIEYPAVLMAICTTAIGLGVSVGTVLWLDR